MGQGIVSGRQFIWGVRLQDVTEVCKGFLDPRPTRWSALVIQQRRVEGPDRDWNSNANAT